jgi:hypothetical protein
MALEEVHEASGDVRGVLWRGANELSCDHQGSARACLGNSGMTWRLDVHRSPTRLAAMAVLERLQLGV